MQGFYIGLALYFSIIVFYTFIIVPYKEMPVLEKIEWGYVTWNENFDYNHHNKFWIPFIGLTRFWIIGGFNKKKKLTKINRLLRDLEQRNPHAYFLLKKNGKIRI